MRIDRGRIFWEDRYRIVVPGVSGISEVASERRGSDCMNVSGAV